MKFPHLHIRCIPQRYLISFECFIILVLSYTMRFSISVAILQMSEYHGAEVNPSDSCPMPKKKVEELTFKKYEFNWTARQQGYIHSGIFWGYFATQILGGVLSDLFNHKAVLLWGFGITAVATTTTPFVARLYDWPGLVVIRVIVGAAQGVCYNALHAVTAHWIPKVERGVLGTLVFAGVQMGNAVNTFVSGILVYHFDWSVVFYVYSIASFTWTLFFFFTTYSKPTEFPGLKEKEQLVFDEYLKEVEKEKAHKKVPLKEIMLCRHVWAIFFGMLGQDWGFYTLVTYIPTYLNNVLHVDIRTNGLYNAISYLILFVNALLCGAAADYIHKKRWFSLTWIRRSIYLIGTVFPALGFLGVTYSECNVTYAIISLFFGLSVLGFFYPSVKVNPMDLSPNFAGTVGSIGQMGGCTAGVLVPFINPFIVKNNHISEWRIFLWLSFGTMLAGGLLFFFLASGEVQKFNEYLPEESNENESKQQK